VSSFRFLHAADIHLDSPLRGLERYEGAPAEEIRNATRLAFTRLVDTALEEEVRFVLLAGDLYDGDWQDYGTGLFVRKQLARLSEKNIPTFLISGNHDAESKITKHLDWPADVRVFPTRKPKTERLPELGVALHGQGYKDPSCADNLAAGYPPALDGFFNIGLLHANVGGQPGHDAYAPCTLADLRAKGYDYWALGHIHLRQTLAQDPWVVYPGNIQGRHIHETGPKGCLLVEVQGGRVANEPRFVPLDVLRWERLVLDVSTCARGDDVVQLILPTLQALETDRILGLRLELSGASPAHGILNRAREHWLNQIRALVLDLPHQSCWLEKVVFRTTPPTESLDAQADESLALLRAEGQALLGDPAQLEAFFDEHAKPLLDKVQAYWPAARLVGDQREALLTDALELLGAAWADGSLAEGGR
jgi:exonuclease SbcD